MRKKTLESGVGVIAVVRRESGEEPLLRSGRAALDLMVDLAYEDNCERMAMYAEDVDADFFKLGTGLAGEVLQKFVNYEKKLAIIGDFSGYDSKPLHDFIYECNKGKDIFFVATEAEAVQRLGAAR